MKTKNSKRKIKDPGISKMLTGILLCIAIVSLSGCLKKHPPEPTQYMDSKPEYWVNVLLLDDVNGSKLDMPCGFYLTSNKKQVTRVYFEKPAKPISVTLSDGRIDFAGWLSDANDLIVLPQSPYIFNLNGDDYRGKLKFVLNPDANSFDVVNIVPVESYLAGVVGAEMPSYWEPSALGAQAIASRTYCLYTKKRFGSKRHFDVRKTQAHQVYLGLKAESTQIHRAVNSTAGQVLICEQPNGSDIFPTYFGSTCGGHTEDSTNVFGGDSFAPLVGVPCGYCETIAKPALFKWKKVSYDKAVVSSRLRQRYPLLKKIGRIQEIIPIRQSDYNDFTRLTMIKLVDAKGHSDVIRAEDFRLTIDRTGSKIKSAAFTIRNGGDKWIFENGRGYGHAVGMCQCGAQAMARQGKTASEILKYYYPNSEIKKIDY
ncbi:SpoIID/LytB domain-containing protein [Planctomycetota bacterium]